MVTALRWAKRAVRLNPKETGYRYLQALLYQSLGMYPEAMEQLELVVRMARSEALRAEAQKALEALEDSFLPLIEDLLRSDWSFRVECLRDVRSALRSRGFRLSESRAEGVRFLAEEISKEPPSGSRMSHA
jgi:tetratricopeptide (TPR) repeat protein